MIRIGILLCLLFNACAHQEAKKVKTVLLPGDIIYVRVFEEKELSGIYEVDYQGNVVLPLLGELQVGYLLISEVRSKIEKSYQEKFFQDPQVFLSVRF